MPGLADWTFLRIASAHAELNAYGQLFEAQFHPGSETENSQVVFFADGQKVGTFDWDPYAGRLEGSPSWSKYTRGVEPEESDPHPGDLTGLLLSKLKLPRLKLPTPTKAPRRRKGS